MKQKSKPAKRMLYADAIKTAAFKRALAKDIMARPDVKACIRGHNLVNPALGHIDVGVLLREKKRACRTCWQKSQAAYEARLAKKANRRKK